ncbi:class-II fumarase/aspartase family protein [Lacrimispora indolis]|uniref:class-II fumarase/aspartase family protein n=1 Tax=Lacrimispora indolis TaxID=69825 RepID=UPI00045EABCA|nr:adenylosuccinate lyase family protein [Lacrimispora indolis]MBE7721895.1 adenylosuccinate lyase family protein [Lacrimispora celerecrescens]
MRAFYDSKSKLDDRGIKKLLGETVKYETWLKVEAALALSQAEEGFIPMEAARDIGAVRLEDLDLNEMEQIKARVGHGFVPFVKVLVKACRGEGGKYVHYGVTTQNIQQTSQLYIAKQVNSVFKSFLADILESLGRQARDHRDTVMAGRTHGRHAIPITYGYKVSVWISELLTSLERLEESEKRVFVTMMGGAAGGFHAPGLAGPRIQERVARKLGMGSMEVPSRNMSQMKLEYLMNLALLCNTFHKMAEEVYYTGIEEFSEVSESFTPGTIGSSTMPQKINPKLSKGIIANSQKLYSLPAVGLYSAVRMFEGDSSSYMLFDGIMEEGLQLTAEVLIRAEELSRTLQINKEQMLKNVNLNQGLDNSEFVMMNVAEKIGKDRAHELMYEKAMETELEGKDYYHVLTEDVTLASMFTADELKSMIDPANYTGLCSVLAEEMGQKALKRAEKLKRTLEPKENGGDREAAADQ